ncbi:MAG TPA: peptide deformylase [Herpetosiphonaceae bacterium]
MAVRRVLQIENPEDYTILKTKAKRVTAFDANLKKLADDLIDTMHETEGVGIAAPQVGVSVRVIVIEEPDETEELEDGTLALIREGELFVMVNPEIIKASPEQCTVLEGCLSLPGRYGEVPRPSWVTVKYQDLSGKEQRVRRAEACGLVLGRIVQHEIDHLDGVLFTERIVDMSTLVDYRESGSPRRRRRLLRRASKENEPAEQSPQ